jgi:hypothetical protein
VYINVCVCVFVCLCLLLSLNPHSAHHHIHTHTHTHKNMKTEHYFCMVFVDAKLVQQSSCSSLLFSFFFLFLLASDRIRCVRARGAPFLLHSFAFSLMHIYVCTGSQADRQPGKHTYKHTHTHTPAHLKRGHCCSIALNRI